MKFRYQLRVWVTASCEPRKPNIRCRTSAVARLVRASGESVFPETVVHLIVNVVGQSLPVAPSSSAGPAVLVSPGARGSHGRVHVGIPLYLGIEVQGLKTQDVRQQTAE